jgi:hypothetical protein
MSDSASDVSSDSTGDIQDILQQEPMYYVLSQFLETPKNKNIAVLLEELVSEIRGLRVAITESRPSDPSRTVSA